MQRGVRRCDPAQTSVCALTRGTLMLVKAQIAKARSRRISKKKKKKFKREGEEVELERGQRRSIAWSRITRELTTSLCTETEKRKKEGKQASRRAGLQSTGRLGPPEEV